MLAQPSAPGLGLLHTDLRIRFRLPGVAHHWPLRRSRSDEMPARRLPTSRVQIDLPNPAMKPTKP
jgi:hypothetical protein